MVEPLGNAKQEYYDRLVATTYSCYGKSTEELAQRVELLTPQIRLGSDLDRYLRAAGLCLILNKLI